MIMNHVIDLAQLILDTNYEDENSDRSEENYNNRHIKEESEECEEFDDLDKNIERTGTDKYVDNDEDVGNDEKNRNWSVY